MENKILHRIEFELTGDEIKCSKGQNDTDSEKLEIYSDALLNTNVYLQFQKKGDKNSNKLVVKNLIYEKLFPKTQNKEIFLGLAEKEAESHLEILKLRLRISNLKLGPSLITDPHYQTVQNIENLPLLIDCPEVLVVGVDSIEKQTKKYLRNYPNYSLNHTLEYVERYNAIQQIKDPVLKLINLASLVEYIEDSSGSKVTSLKQAKYKWLKATRNLISHGVVDRSHTLDLLNSKLGLSETKFVFNRKDHLDLVQEAIQIYNQELYTYLSNLLL